VTILNRISEAVGLVGVVITMLFLLNNWKLIDNRLRFNNRVILQTCRFCGVVLQLAANFRSNISAGICKGCTWLVPIHEIMLCDSLIFQC